jgi:hypothetical protein
MKNTFAAMIFAAGFVGSPVLAQEVDMERVDLFVSVIVDAGCMMTEQSAGTLMPASGFTDRDETQAIVGYLMNEGLASVRGGVLKIETPECAEFDTPYDALQKEFFTYMATRECTISYEESRTAFPEAGFDLGTLDNLIEGLMKIEGSAIDYSSEVITIKPEFCS